MQKVSSQTDPSDWVVVGRFGRVHGIKGFITVISFTDPRDNILAYTHWHGIINGQYIELPILQSESNDKSMVVLIDGYPVREKAAELTNVEIVISRDQLAPLTEGEYYCHELIGMTVVNLQNETLGQVVDIMPTGANDVLVVQGEKQVLIPYVPERYVLEIDRQQGTIRVDWEQDY